MPSANSASTSTSTSNSSPSKNNSNADILANSYAVLDVGAHSLRISIGSFDPTTTSSSSSSSRSNNNKLLSSIQSCPNAIARSRQGDSTSTSGSGSSDGRTFIGSSITTHCKDYASLVLRLPQEKGFITDWQAQKAVWDREFFLNHEIQKTLNQKSRFNPNPNSKDKDKDGIRLLEGRICIITESVFNLPDLEENLEALLFEEYGAAAVWRCSAPQLAPYSEIFSSSIPIPHPTIPTFETENLDSGISFSSDQPMTKLEKWRSRGRARGKKSTGTTRGNQKSSSSSTRPDCMLIVDLGHSASHALPIYKDEVLWDAVRRLSVGGKLLTNLLKETLSFRQWDMMDETWLVGALKEKCCFVAPGGKGSRKFGTKAKEEGKSKRASDWEESDLREICKGNPNKNPILQEYVLPDYSYELDSSKKFGFIKSGPGSVSANKAAEIREKGRLASRESELRNDDLEQDVSMSLDLNPNSSLNEDANSSLNSIENPTSPATTFLRDSSRSESQIQEEVSRSSAILDSFIVDFNLLSDSKSKGEEGDENEDEEEDEDDEDDEDFDENDEDEDDDENQSRKKQKKSKGNGNGEFKEKKKPKVGKKSNNEEDEDEQVLIMSNERFSVPEVLFAPNQIGLPQSPLPELIASSINATPEGMRGPLWGNIVLIGGTSNLPGMKERLGKELRALAPSEYEVKILHPENPELIPTLGALHLLNKAHSSPNSHQAKLLKSRLTTKSEWDQYGIAISRAKSGTWSSLALERNPKVEVNQNNVPVPANQSGILPVAIMNSLRGISGKSGSGMGMEMGIGSGMGNGNNSGLEFRTQSLMDLDPFVEVIHKEEAGSRARRALDRQR